MTGRIPAHIKVIVITVIFSKFIYILLAFLISHYFGLSKFYKLSITIIYKKVKKKLLAVVAWALNPSTREAETGGSW